MVQRSVAYGWAGAALVSAMVWSCGGSDDGRSIEASEGGAGAAGAESDGGARPVGGTPSEAGASRGGAAGGPSSDCGDGVIEGDETCDDGNAIGDDGCDEECQAENGFACKGTPSECAAICGDGEVLGDEVCDDGNEEDGDYCSADCSEVTGACGDGELQDLEVCDDGNSVDDDYCSSDCQTEGSCGDGTLQSNEDCDEDVTGCTDCVAEVGFVCSRTDPVTCEQTCGDGSLVGSEECDDGGLQPGDGCGSSCRVEAGWECQQLATGTTACTEVCGDGEVVGAEACDDGNEEDGDYCSADCSTSFGACGDGAVELDAGEQCDDGGTSNGDGCNASCQLEDGWDCSGEPSACACESWTLSFELTGQFEIADTFLGAGDGTFDVGPGTLTLRLESDASGTAPGDGAAVLVEYTMHQEFDQDIPLLGGQVQTNVEATAGPDEPACGRATGALDGSTLTWDDCPTSDNYGDADWSPDDALSGPGCVDGYHSEGVVVCTSTTTGCSQGNLVQGENPQDDTWNQPFSDLTVDLENGMVTMGRTQIPNRADSSTTWISFSGTETGRACAPTPTDCE